MYRLILSSIIVLGAALNVPRRVHRTASSRYPAGSRASDRNPREKLRLAPAPTLEFDTQELGLPSSGPKGSCVNRATRKSTRPASTAIASTAADASPALRQTERGRRVGAALLVREQRARRGAAVQRGSMSSPMLLVASRQSPAIGI